MAGVTAASPAVAPHRGLQLALLATSVCLVFFQAQVVAPLVPMLAADLTAPTEAVGLLIPAYALPYGLMALVYGPLSDRLGRRAVVLLCICALGLASLGAVVAPFLDLLLVLRVAAGVSAGGVMPVSLACTADLFAYRERGRAIGVIFGAVALGQAAGYSLGPVVAAAIGWRGVFALMALVALVLAVALALSPLPGRSSAAPVAALTGYRQVLGMARARRVYAFIITAGLCVSGVTAWFGVYVHDRFGLEGLAIGLAYLPYGVAGMLSPLGGLLADRHGRGRLIPLGLLTIALGTAPLALDASLPLALLGVAAIALGFQLTYPLLAGLASEFAPAARGSALGLNTFSMFMGVGWGALLAGLLLPWGYGAAFGALALVALAGGLLGVVWLRHEH